MKLTSRINDFYYHMSLYELQVMSGDDYFNGLSYNSLLYINVIEQMEDCTASKIAETLGITRSAVMIKLNELERQGAIVKEKSETDRRVTYVRLSPAMADTCSIYDEIFEKIELDLRLKYTAEELDMFSKILQDISSYEWRRVKHE